MYELIKFLIFHSFLILSPKQQQWAKLSRPNPLGMHKPIGGKGDIIPGQFNGKEVFGGMINFQFVKFFVKPNYL